jgi:hypothetical protein
VIATSPVHWRADFCLATSYKHSFTEIQLLLLRNVPCLQSCCLATRSSNTPYYMYIYIYMYVVASVVLHLCSFVLAFKFDGIIRMHLIC